MMRLVGLFIFSGAVVVFGKFNYNPGRDTSLHVQEGECWFRGYKLKAGVKQDMEKPCESWICTHSNSNSRVDIIGCSQANVSVVDVDPYEPVPQDKKKLFPVCCTQK
uniref:Single domain-containing protein n=1 Tax=Amblyomma cajennense TaxID=34607 RepID=A0A023FCQ6_AMBCJ